MASSNYNNKSLNEVTPAEVALVQIIKICDKYVYVSVTPTYGYTYIEKMNPEDPENQKRIQALIDITAEDVLFIVDLTDNLKCK
jgi:hypothetical protein